MTIPTTTASMIEGAERERRVSRELVRRMVRHLADGKTSDYAPATMELDPAVYTDPVRFEAERRELFLKLPLLAGWSCDIPNPGDMMLFEAAGPSILVVRGEDGKVRAFLNTCRHRMAEVVRDCSNRNRLTCPFHAWTYNLQGELVSVPGEHDAFPGLDKAAHGLTPTPVGEWGGLIFVKAHAGDESIDVEAYLGALAPELKQLDFARCAPIRKTRVDVQANWKVAADTYFEAYHFAALHPTSFAPTVLGNVQLHDSFGPHERINAISRSYLDLVGKPESDWPESWYQGTHLIFPNTIFFAMQVAPSKPEHTSHRPWYGVWRMFPGERPGESFSLMETYRPADAPADEIPEFEAFHDFVVGTIRDEDYSVCAGMQRSMEADVPGRKVILGRNEAAVQAIERNIAQAIGMPLS